MKFLKKSPSTLAIHSTLPAIDQNASHAAFPRFLWKMAIPVVIFWVLLTVIVNVIVPQLDTVGEMRAISLSPNDAPAMIALKRIGKVFNEFHSDSAGMVVLESDHPLDSAAHHYYDTLVKKMSADHVHVEHVQDFWSDPLTASGSQSADNLAAYVQVYLAGNMGETLANESAEAIEHIIATTPAPPGVKAYLTGTAALNADQHTAGNASLQKMTGLTFIVIIAMLLGVYRSFATVLIVLAMVGLELVVARGIIAVLGYYNIILLSVFSVNLLVTLAIAAATDYAIFLLGRYQEARANGHDRESSFYSMYEGTWHVIAGSGLTIAGATFCLHFTRLPAFQSLAIPLAIGMLVVLSASLTFGACLVVVVSRFGLLEPKRAARIRTWRRIGTVIVRWPGLILILSVGVCLVGLFTLPGYRTSYNDRRYLPDYFPANIGFNAADRHFSQARMNPDLLMIEADHDLRNATDFLVINRIAKHIVETPGIARVQTITRPLGSPIKHTSVPFQLSMQAIPQQLNLQYMLDRMKDIAAMGDDMEVSIHDMERMLEITKGMADATHHMDLTMHEMQDIVTKMRDEMENFLDFWRPIRSYFYWEPHCTNIPICSSIRSIFDMMDTVDQMSENVDRIVPQIDRMDTLVPQMVEIMPSMIDMMKDIRTKELTMQSTMEGLQLQIQKLLDNQNAMGRAFDDSKNDDSFYLPPEAFKNPDFKRGMKMFFSPDGHAVRFIISHEGDPLSAEGLSHIPLEQRAIHEALKGTPLDGSKIYLTGTAAIYRDMSICSSYDLLIAGISSLCLIFIIMLFITRAVAASAIIVGTVMISLGTSFGISVLVWQHIIGLELHWMVLAMSVIILLAVGSDYNLLLVSRMKEEIHGAGLNTAIIRAMGGSGSVVTSAGLVFAFTMMAMLVSDLRVIGQVGSTIGLGLLMDTLVIRSFMTPSIAALLGRWFWWPQRVYARPVKLYTRST